MDMVPWEYEDEDDKLTSYQRAKNNANNCRADIRNGMTEEERITAAQNFGPNWANIMSGLGDQ